MPKASEPPLWWARFTVPGTGFFTYCGHAYDRGQLLTLSGGPRDGRLIELGYVQEAPKSESHLHAQCGVCGAEFVNEHFRDDHGRLRHRDRFAKEGLEPREVEAGMETPWGPGAVRDTTGDTEERRQMQDFPLYLDKTIASQRG